MGTALGAAAGAALGAAIDEIGAGVGALLGAALYAPAEAFTSIEEAQRGMVSTIDTIDLDGDEEIDIRGWIRTFADSGKPTTSATTRASGTRTAAM